MNPTEMDPRAYARVSDAIDEIIATWPDDRRASFDERYGDRKNSWAARVMVDAPAGLAAVEVSIIDPDHGFVPLARIDGSRVGYHVIGGELLYDHVA